jgi:hypothetical protein
MSGKFRVKDVIVTLVREPRIVANLGGSGYLDSLREVLSHE